MKEAEGRWRKEGRNTKEDGGRRKDRGGVECGRSASSFLHFLSLLAKRGKYVCLTGKYVRETFGQRERRKN